MMVKVIDENGSIHWVSEDALRSGPGDGNGNGNGSQEIHIHVHIHANGNGSARPTFLVKGPGGKKPAYPAYAPKPRPPQYAPGPKKKKSK